MSLISANLPPAAPPLLSQNDNPAVKVAEVPKPQEVVANPLQPEPLAVPLAPEGRFPNQGDLFSMLFDLDGNNTINLEDFSMISEAESDDLVKLYEAAQLGANAADPVERKA